LTAHDTWVGYRILCHIGVPHAAAPASEQGSSKEVMTITYWPFAR
jgi:hypothetical protein